jgi:hypothetical protein
MTSSPLASPSIGKKFFATSILLLSCKTKKEDMSKRIIHSDAQTPLLKYALGTDKYEDIKKFEEDKIQSAGAGFKSSLKQNEQKTKRLRELANETKSFSMVDYSAVRMPNNNTKVEIEENKICI